MRDAGKLSHGGLQDVFLCFNLSTYIQPAFATTTHTHTTHTTRACYAPPNRQPPSTIPRHMQLQLPPPETAFMLGKCLNGAVTHTIGA